MRTLGVNVGSTGLSEERAINAGFEPVTAIGPFNDKSHYYPGGKNVTVKVVADRKSRRLLGVQAVGPGEVQRVIDAAVSALRFGATLEDVGMMDFAYAPPFGTPIEPLSQVCNVVMNKLDGVSDCVAPLDLVEKLAGDDDFVLLDIRSEGELEKRPAVEDERVMHINMMELRQRIGEVPKDKEVIVMCQLGQRAYDMACALKGAGVEKVAFAEGGMNVFDRIKK